MEIDYLMTVIDIFNPQISKVAKGIEGKAILVYSDNGLGKTLQATRMPKPYYIGFEMGIRGISGVPFLPVNSWGDFKKVNKQLTDPRTLEKAKGMYQTIIFDEVYASARMCQDYICRKYGAEHIGEPTPQGENRPNLYVAYEAEYFREIDKLLKSGYTLMFIGHETTDNDTKQIIPKGDKRSMQVIRDNADFCIWLSNNGVDEDGKAINSSAHFFQTPQYFARSRYTKMVSTIPNYTAENLEAAITKAIEDEEKEKGVASVTFDEQKEMLTAPKKSIAEAIAKAQEIGGKIAELGFLQDVIETVEKHLGKGIKLTDAKKGQEDIIEVLTMDLEDILLEKQEEAS